MIVHELVDVAQETRGDDADGAKRDTGQVHVLVAFGVGHLAGVHDHRVRRLVPRDAGDQHEIVQQRGAGEGDGFGDVAGVGDAELEFHRAADVVDGVGHELADEDVVVDGVADGAADDTDGEGESGNGGNQILRQWVSRAIQAP